MLNTIIKSMSIEEYEAKFKEMISRLSYTKYIFDVCKMCGHGEFVIIDKDDTLSNLYKSVARQYEFSEIKVLFLKNDETNETRIIPNNDMTLRFFISKFYGNMNLRNFFKPIYSGETTKVVYRIYFQ
jgi:hypothetical protein